jgi:hypothetical protein
MMKTINELIALIVLVVGISFLSGCSGSGGENSMGEDLQLDLDNIECAAGEMLVDGLCVEWSLGGEITEEDEAKDYVEEPPVDPTKDPVEGIEEKAAEEKDAAEAPVEVTLEDCIKKKLKKGITDCSRITHLCDVDNSSKLEVLGSFSQCGEYARNWCMLDKLDRARRHGKQNCESIEKRCDVTSEELLGFADLMMPGHKCGTPIVEPTVEASDDNVVEECLPVTFDDRTAIPLVVKYDGGYLVNNTAKMAQNDTDNTITIFKGPNYRTGDRVRFFEHDSFKGKHISVGPGVYGLDRLREKGLHGMISSAKIIVNKDEECAEAIDKNDDNRYLDPIPMFVKYYNDSDGKGWAHTALKSTALVDNDRASSIEVFKGPDWDEGLEYRAKFFEHSPASGKSTAYGPGTYKQLGDHNDMYSYVLIAATADNDEGMCPSGTEPHEYNDDRVAVPLVVELTAKVKGEIIVETMVSSIDRLWSNDDARYIKVLRGPNYRYGDKVKLCKHKGCEGDRENSGDMIEIEPGIYGKTEISGKGFSLGELSAIHFIPDGAEGSCVPISEDGLTWKDPIPLVVDTFEHDDFEGGRYQIIGDNHLLGANNWISSLRVHKGPHYFDSVVTFYHETGYDLRIGNHKSYEAGSEIESVGSKHNDKFTSVNFRGE